MRFHRATALVVVLILTTSSAYAYKGDGRDRPKRTPLTWQDVLFGGALPTGAGEARRVPDLTAYEGLGSWVDIFNTGPWNNPKRAVRMMAKRGAKTIFLQTSTYGRSGGIYDEAAVNAYLHHAHKRGMKVVAWYVPSFAQQRIDLQRSLRAINYRSPTGERFDSFGLDIEATHVGNISLRNRRLIALSKRIRRAAGGSYPLSAITPDPIASSYWPRFPWKETAKIYDVIVPMGYFTFRAHGFQEVRKYTSANIKKIRRETGNRDVPIHFIGGIADDARPHDVKGFVKATREHNVMGASLYDYPITSRRSWYEMRALDASVAQRRRIRAREVREAEAERARLARERRREAEDKKSKQKKGEEGKIVRRAKRTIRRIKKDASSLSEPRSPAPRRG